MRNIIRNDFHFNHHFLPSYIAFVNNYILKIQLPNEIEHHPTLKKLVQYSSPNGKWQVTLDNKKENKLNPFKDQQEINYASQIH